MAHVIRVDDDVWNQLEKKALELGKAYESRNTILRMILGLPPKEERSQKHSRTEPKQRTAPKPHRRPGGRPETI